MAQTFVRARGHCRCRLLAACDFSVPKINPQKPHSHTPRATFSERRTKGRPHGCSLAGPTAPFFALCGRPATTRRQSADTAPSVGGGERGRRVNAHTHTHIPRCGGCQLIGVAAVARFCHPRTSAVWCPRQVTPLRNYPQIYLNTRLLRCRTPNLSRRFYYRALALAGAESRSSDLLLCAITVTVCRRRAR